MQTFLPYPSFLQTARCLDRQRLGKQRIEAVQILHTLKYRKGGWKNHPAVKMWDGYRAALGMYALTICQEWLNRGYVDNQIPVIMELAGKNHHEVRKLPPWLGKERFHRSHQSNLVRKFPEHYRRYFPNVPDNLQYEWPTVWEGGTKKKPQYFINWSTDR